MRTPFRFLRCLLTLLALASGAHAQAPTSQGYTPNKFGFTGHEYDAETGLIYFKARYYDPEIGRFISADRYEGDPKRPVSWNAYLYAHGNPLTYIDKDGHAAIDAIESFTTAAINTLFAKSRLDGFDELMAKRAGAIPRDAAPGSYGSRFKVDFRKGGITKEFVPAPSMAEEVKETLLLGIPSLGQAIGETAGALDVRLREGSSQAQRDAADADLGRAGFAATAAIATRQAGQAMKQHYASPRPLPHSPPPGNLGHPDAVLITESPNGIGVVWRHEQSSSGRSGASQAGPGMYSDKIPGARVEGIYDAMNPGRLPDRHAANFTGGRYEEIVLSQPTSFSRAHGGRAGPIGKDGTYVSIDPQVGGLQSAIDYGVNPAWGNNAGKVSRIVVPADSTLYVGQSANQGGVWVGGRTQVYIPPGVKVEVK